MSEDPIKIPKPSDVLGNNKIPSPSDILGDTEKKKSTSIIASQKSDSVMNVGSLGGVKFPKYDINEYNTKKPLVKKEVNNIVRDKVSTTPVSRLEVSKEQLNRNNEVTEKKVKELTLASKPYTQISPEKEQEANQDYDNALNKTGVWNKVKQFGTDVLNTSMNVLNKAGMVDEVGDLKLEDPLKKAKEQTLKEVKEQDLSLTNSQFQEKVKDNFTQNRKNEIIHSQLNQFNSDLSPEDRNLLQVDRYNHLTNLDGSQKELLSNTQILKHNRLDTFNEHNALISDINKFVIEGQEPPQELLDKKVSLESNLKDYDTQINKNYQKFSNNKKDIGTFEQELAVYKTEGNDFLNFLGHVKNATLKLGAEGIDFGAYVANVSSNLPSNIPAKILSDYLHDKANKLNESIEEDNATLKQTNTVESPLDFAHKTLNVVADNIPIIAGLTLTGGAGLAGMGATTAGAKFGEMKNEVDKGEANYSNMKMALIPLAWGGTVLAPMATQLKTIQNGSRVLEAIAKESPELIQKTIKEKAIQYLSDAKTFGKESFKLGNELKVMGILQEGINHFGLGKDVNYDNLLDLGVYADAPVMHGMGKVAPHLLGMSVKPFMNSTDVKNMDSNSAKIFELTKKLNDESTPKEEKDIIQKSINSIAENSKTIIEGKIKSISETPDLVHKEIIAKTLESSNIRSEALRIKTSDNLTDSEKTIALNELKIKYKQNESDRVDFISGNKTVLDILPQKEVLKLKNEASRELMQEQNPDGTKSVKLENVEITKRALENYKKELETKKIEDAKTESPNTETKPQPEAEVQEPTNAEQAKVDESVQNGDIIPDGSVPIRDNADLQQSKVENLQSSSNIGEGKTPIEVEHKGIVYSKNENGVWTNTKSGNEVKGIGEKGKALIKKLDVKLIAPKKYKLTEKGQAFEVKNVEGKLQVFSSKGEVVSKPTERAVLRKHADNIDLTVGEKAIDNPNFEAQDWENEVAKKSNNPAEIADTIHYAEIEDVSNMSEIEKKSHTEQIIADGLVPIKESGFDRFGDTNNKTKKTKSYFDNENGREIDDLAQELSGRAGVEISPNDIADFIAEYPDGIKSYHEKVKGDLTQEQIAKSNKIEALKTKFTELTGLPANKEFLLKAIEQQNRKENGNNVLDQLSDAELTAKYNEILESQKQTDGSTETKQDAKGIDEKQNITAPETTSGGEIKENISNEQTKSEREQVNYKYNKDSFEVFASKVPNGEVGEYLSGKTIEKYTGEKPQNNQEILKVKLEEALIHGVSTIEKAKDQFGEDYVSKTLDHLKSESISPEAKALTYISLENELVKQIKNNDGDNLTIQKQLDLVREKRQAFARSNSLALNMNRLQKFGEIGFDVNAVTDKLFSEKQKEAKSVIEENIQHKPEDINKQSDLEQSENVSTELKDLIQEGIDKQINEIYKRLPTSRRIKADKAIKVLENIQKDLRSKTYDASIGVPIALIDGGITIIKNAIKAGVNIADAIELGIDHIKDKFGKDWEKEKDFRKDMIDGFKSKNIDLKDKTKAEDSAKEIVKQSLIEAGYYREVTFNGEKVKRLDWVKLAGEEGSVENIKNKVEEVLTKNDKFSKKEITEMQQEFKDEYARLGAEIIQKGLNELEKRNLIKPSPNRKSEAKRLSELYNFGLLEKNANEYDNLLNKTLGLSQFEQNVFDEIKAKIKALADTFNTENNGKKLTENSIQTVANDLNHQIKELLNAVSYKEGDFKYKLITVLTDYAGLSQKALLGGLPNLIENVTSGRFAGLEQKLYTDKVLTPELRKQIKNDRKIIYDDITKNAGLYYGDTNTSLVSSSRFEDWVNGKTDNRMTHAVISAITLRSWLDGADSRAKVTLSSKLFIKNAVDILSSESNPNGAMSKEDAVKFVSESLTGDSFKKALETSKSIIDKVNSKQETKQLKDTPEAIHRFAMNLVKENLMQDNRMTMEQIDVAFKSGYKSAGRDIGHEANNPISKGVNMLNASINGELEKAVSEKRYGEATALSAKMLVMRTIVNPFVGGGTNWVILGLEKSGNPLGYISTLFNATKKQELDLGTVSGIKNMSESLYRKNNYQASLTRNIIGTSVALSLFIGMNVDIDDEEDAKDKLNKWLEENKWAKRYFEKLSPEALVFMISLENKELGKHLAKNLGINGDTFNNTSKLLKSLDKEGESTSGKAGQVIGSPLNSPLAWKTVKDIQNVIRGLEGKEQITTDYKATGFWNGYFQGGLTDFLGMRPDSKNTTSSSSSGVKVSKKKFKKYKKF